MFNVKKLAIGATAAGMLGAAAFGVTAFAQTATPGQAGPNSGYAQVFETKLASLLHVDVPTLNTDVKQAQNQTIDQMVADGKITQDHANQLKQRVDQNGGHLQFFEGHGGRDGRGGPGGQRGAEGQMFPAIAQRLGISADDLRAQLRSGQKLSDVAAAHSVSHDDLKAAVVAAVKAQLDPQVSGGQLTQQQEDAILTHVQQDFENLWNGTMPQGGPGRGGRGQGPNGQPGTTGQGQAAPGQGPQGGGQRGQAPNGQG